ncbi:crossover junction endodeoxyribonuclease RuvC [Cohaesibacter celericrescens]|uniref:Crossover junction endodeoxyribonuclease RuvC n=1 Tax=Cohaesibacter celericrescens TaxID=2067669 RepID=A0A2N5XL52_9HYPH|nr:crossover junction endodeoxyribonuclease RuvC [Cohaesibacter celericrescens]PLW75224.1 crossover junction endodeoxyribonuclease RuvC [Cohaesibacter celericrescens]
MKEHPIRIVGFDPGLRRTGWGAIDVISNRLIFVGSGLITSDNNVDLATRLLQLHCGVMGVLEKYEPQEVSVEQTFVNKDAVATLKLGQARAISLLAPAQRGLPVSEYAPNAVKKTVVGVGHADKKQVQTMVKMLLPKATFDSEDAADALAIAICHAHQRGAKAYKIA